MIVLLVVFLFAVSVSEGATRKPQNPRCGQTAAPLLCLVHWQRATANYWRARMSLKPFGYAYQAERQPHRRRYLLWFWTGKRIAAKRQYELWSKAPWLHAPWLPPALCVASHEGGVASNTGNGYYGMFQADLSFQQAYGAEYYRRWGTADRWPREAQLHMAYRGWLARGWSPWPNTAAMCGLL